MTKKENIRLIIAIIAIVILLAAGWYYFSNSSSGSFAMASNPYSLPPSPDCLYKPNSYVWPSSCSQVRDCQRAMGGLVNCTDQAPSRPGNQESCFVAFSERSLSGNCSKWKNLCDALKKQVAIGTIQIISDGYCKPDISINTVNSNSDINEVMNSAGELVRSRIADFRDRAFMESCLSFTRFGEVRCNAVFQGKYCEWKNSKCQAKDN